MKAYRTEFALAAVLLLLCAATWLWQTPGSWRAAMSAADVEGYLRDIEQRLPLPTAEKPAVLAHLRAWALADDGAPVFMLNLMRYYPALRRFEGTPDFAGTPREANAIYEQRVAPMLLKTGGYPVFGGMTQGANVLGFGPGQDGWDRVLVVRYPSRRAFLELLTDPAYAPIEPYKMMALEVVLTPMQGEVALPELRVLVCVAALVLFLFVAWIRALARGKRT
jgi:hypothetical protein